MRIKPFLHRASNWGGYYKLVFINHDGKIREIHDAIDYKVKNDAIEYTLDDTSEHYTQDRLIAVVEVERGF